MTHIAPSGVTTVLKGRLFLDVFGAPLFSRHPKTTTTRLTMRLSSTQWDGTKAVKRRRGTLGRGTIFHICCPDHKGTGVPASQGAHVAIGRAHTDR